MYQTHLCIGLHWFICFQTLQLIRIVTKPSLLFIFFLHVVFPSELLHCWASTLDDCDGITDFMSCCHWTKAKLPNHLDFSSREINFQIEIQLGHLHGYLLGPGRTSPGSPAHHEECSRSSSPEDKTDRVMSLNMLDMPWQCHGLHAFRHSKETKGPNRCSRSICRSR